MGAAYTADRYFYPRPPRGGRRVQLVENIVDSEFLSTPSARRATRQRADQYVPGEISIHALREEGDFLGPTSICDIGDFYPRPPRGGRHLRTYRTYRYDLFLSTPSARRATRHITIRASACAAISIHALREEGDRADHRTGGKGGNFYPRPPRGGRPTARPIIKPCSVFLSTPSARRATFSCSHR